METVLLRGENRSLRAQLRDRFRLENIVGQHGSMQEVFRLVQKVASSPATVIIYGESGTGKELIARALHYNSPRASRPFIAVNCSAIPEPLLESELFGHEKGSFTGAVARKLGLFEQAHAGTLLLDEVGDLPLPMQAKILRVVQEKEIRRVGGASTIPVDVRIVAATNKSLGREMKEGRFREDLYYRLNVLPIFLPPLRERATDIPGLAEHFLARQARESGKKAPRLPAETLSLLMRYRWPGNVRELENAIERACALCDEGIIKPQDLPPQVVRQAALPAMSGEPSSMPVGRTLDDFVREQERRYIDETIKFNGGSREKAAKMLGISMATLYRKLEVKKNVAEVGK
jgi:transcriptional regulator with PAS, ATPase and Fis domain